MIDDGLPELPPEVPGLPAHVLDGRVQLGGGLLPGVSHVVVQEVLAHGLIMAVMEDEYEDGDEDEDGGENENGNGG